MLNCRLRLLEILIGLERSNGIQLLLMVPEITNDQPGVGSGDLVRA